VPYPDIQLLFTPASYVFGRALVLDEKPGMTVAVCPTRPKSRGSVLAQSADPQTPPHIRFGYMTDASDLEVMLSGMAQARRILNAPSLAPYLVEEVAPGSARQQANDLEHFIRSE